MLFTLQGFSHRNTVRVYQFLRVDAAFVRTRFTVDVDLRSMAEFHIPVQEAPLMCRHLLENLPEGDALRQLALTTENMRTSLARVNQLENTLDGFLTAFAHQTVLLQVHFRSKREKWQLSSTNDRGKNEYDLVTTSRQKCTTRQEQRGC